MGILSRRSTATAAPPGAFWQPASAEVPAVRGYEMDDEGCAGEDAHGVTFTLQGAPGATITVWLYATFAAPDAPADFQTGWRCDYSYADGSRRAPWTATFYGCDDPDFYDDLDAAEAAAREAAEALARTGLAGGTGETDPDCFDWDGIPW